MKIRIWIKAFRLRTLPLALSSAILGSFLAYAQGTFQWKILILAVTTTLFLQILSNLAKKLYSILYAIQAVCQANKSYGRCGFRLSDLSDFLFEI